MSRCIAGGVQVVGRRKRLLHAQPATSASVDTTQDIQVQKQRGKRTVVEGARITGSVHHKSKPSSSSTSKQRAQAVPVFADFYLVHCPAALEAAYCVAVQRAGASVSTRAAAPAKCNH
jgi:hypothetical protein